MMPQKVRDFFRELPTGQAAALLLTALLIPLLFHILGVVGDLRNRVDGLDTAIENRITEHNRTIVAEITEHNRTIDGRMSVVLETLIQVGFAPRPAMAVSPSP